MTRPIPARFNFRFDDALRRYNFGHRGHIFAPRDTGPRRFDPLGKALKKMVIAPDWYVAAKSSPYFTNAEPEESASLTASASPEESVSPTVTPIPTYKSPDGSVELILREDPNDEDDQIDGPGHAKHFLLRDLKTGAETEFEKLPGFYGVYGLLHDSHDKDQHFLFDGLIIA